MAGLTGGLEASEIDVVVLGGDPMPDGNGIYTNQAGGIEEPLLGNDGMVLFFAEVLGSADASGGALSLASRDLLAVVARESQPESVLTGFGEGEFTNLGGTNEYALGELGVTGFVSAVMFGGVTSLSIVESHRTAMFCRRPAGFSLQTRVPSHSSKMPGST